MKLMTKEVENLFKKIGRQEDVEDPIVVAIFSTPAEAEIGGRRSIFLKTGNVLDMFQSLVTTVTSGDTSAWLSLRA